MLTVTIGKTEEVVEKFFAREIPINEWTHEAHLRVALWHLLRFNPEESLIRLRNEIKDFNGSIGVSNTATSGYHETITYFYVSMITNFLSQLNNTRPIDELAQTMLVAIGGNDIFLDYYSKERFFSSAGRNKVLEPDIRPLPIFVQH